MVKAVTYTIVAILLSVALFIFADWFIVKQFDEFAAALDSLYVKIENETATHEDGLAVKTMWSDKKEKLHVFLPHNDISYVDYWLGECCGLLKNGQYELALGKIEVLKEISRTLPDAYRLNFENIF